VDETAPSGWKISSCLAGQLETLDILLQGRADVNHQWLDAICESGVNGAGLKILYDIEED